MDAVQRLALEWVLLNGTLPDFNTRVQSSLSSWPRTERDLVVYRAQGHSIPGIPRVGDAREIVSGLRPVVATSISPNSVLRYAGADCCVFEITIPAGTPYIDTTAVLSDVSDTLLTDVRDAAAAAGLKFPPATISPKSLRAIIAKRLAAEQEIMLPGNGKFSSPTPISPIGEKDAFALTYTPTSGGRRGRTFRRKAVRRNKYGSRLARKSQRHVRNRHA
jgi:hypothetical protein